MAKRGERTPRVTASFGVEAELRDLAEDEANRRGVTFSELMRTILAEALGRKQQQPLQQPHYA